MPMAIVIPADETLPIEKKELNGLDDYQAAVGGWIESVPMPSGAMSMYINEEGKVHGLSMNKRATSIVESMLFQGDFIVGDAIVVGFNPTTGDDADVPDCFQP